MNNGAATPTLADQVTREVLGWIDQERALIKPALPDTESWFRSENLLMKTRVAANGLQDFQANDLFKAGWNASIRNGPGCDQLIRMADASGVPRAQVRQLWRSRNVLQTPRYVYCIDDNGTLQAYDLDLFRYDNAAHIQVYVTRDIGTVLARQNGSSYFDVKKYSYLG